MSKGMVALLAVLAALGALFASQAPELKRYIKIDRM
jgi:hypothetical protein